MGQPLADRIRPQQLEDVIGQNKIVGKNGVLRKIIESGNIPNMIFYGPSGTGKTTVANIIAQTTNKSLYKVNATNAGSQDIKDVIAQIGRLDTQNGILLYIDEIQYITENGTMRYKVSEITEIEDTDWSKLSKTEDNRITLITCVRNVPTKRYCVQAVEI